MTKYESLSKYANKLKERLSEPTPSKHEGSDKQYREFLTNDLNKTLAKLADLKETVKK